MPTADFDYMLITNQDGSINSRWFVMEAKYEKGEGVKTSGQYSLMLKRDLLADYYYALFSATCYIDRAMLQYGDKYIFNSENQLYNQVKKSEVLLKDETKCGWLVGYIAASALDNIEIVAPAEDASFPAPPISYEELTTLNGRVYNVSNPTYQFQGQRTASGGVSDVVTTSWSVTVSEDSVLGATEIPLANAGIIFDTNLDDAGGKILVAVQNNKTALRNAATAYTVSNTSGTNKTEEYINTLANMNNIWFQDGATIFRVSSVRRTQEQKVFGNLGSNAGSIYTTLRDTLNSSGAAHTVSGYSKTGFNLFTTLVGVDFELEIYNSGTLSTTLKSTARILEDAPYRMFAMPVGSPATIYNGETIYPVANVAKKFGMRLATALGGTGVSNIYDLQYLPYCPVRNAINDEGKIELFGGEYTNYNLIKNGDNVISYMLWASVSNFSLNITHRIEVPKTATEFKIEHETKFCRLCAPNYSGAFEFKPTANYGVDYFEVCCSYKPYQPYIFVCPHYNLNGLYGGDFDDQRGLVITGNFSISMVDDAWTDYQIQNKAFLLTKERTVENMEANYQAQRSQMSTAGVINALSATLSGAGAGAIVGGNLGGYSPAALGIGAGVGAATGLATGLIGRGADLKYLERAHEEAVDYYTDLFAHQVYSIQALPYSLGKVDAFSINNKIFPFIEFYSATDEEITALRSKIKYQSMNVGRIGSIEEFMSPTPQFISARVIRMNINEDDHLITELSNLMHRGFYI